MKGSSQTLYIFKRHTLHQIIEPTAAQSDRAKTVTDTFLRQYTHGRPVNWQGQELSHLQPDPLPQPVSLDDGATSSSVGLAGLGWQIAGLVLLLAGGGWLLVQLFSQPQNKTSPPLSHPHLGQAVLYAEQIEQMLDQPSNEPQQQLLRQVHRWKQMIEALVERINILTQNRLLQRDVNQLPGLIADLEQQLSTEIQPVLHNQLGRTLIQRRQQLQIIEGLQTMTRQAEMQIETTVASLGTIYSQLLSYQSTADVADYGQLLVEVDEEINCLQDHLSALQEVKMEKVSSSYTG